MTIEFSSTADWLNDNQGVVGVGLFAITALFGWMSGIFSALRKRPKLEIETLLGPTFCCTFCTGNKFDQYDAHRTAIALYLSISNIGSAASSIKEIHVGYHWAVHRFSKAWLRYGIGWFWLKEQAVALADFQVKIGDMIKAYPFLTQRSHISRSSSETYLKIGQSTNGVVYFEQPESWGGCCPLDQGGKTRIKLRIYDAFGGCHSTKIWVDLVTLDEAKKYNPAFGTTFFTLSGSEPSATANEMMVGD